MMKNKILITLFMLVLIVGGVSPFFDQASISFSERRSLAVFPDVWENGNLNAGFFDEADKYYSDHFLLRDEFRALKGFVISQIFHIGEYNGVFMQDNYLFKKDEFDQKAVERNIAIINEIAADFNNCYLTIIPNKAEYARGYHDNYDFNELVSLINEKAEITFIDISSSLSLEDYYRTDIHWRQEQIGGIAELLVSEMEMSWIAGKYENESYYPFYGALYAEIAPSVKPDTLVYLDSETIKQAKVYDLESDKYITVYDQQDLLSPDAYDIFLGGPKAYLKIENPASKTDQKLIIFRDSFASSIAPLLIESFEQIELIDLRYYDRSLIKDLKLDNEATVLFMYGSQIINSYAVR